MSNAYELVRDEWFFLVNTLLFTVRWTLDPPLGKKRTKRRRKESDDTLEGAERIEDWEDVETKNLWLESCLCSQRVEWWIGAFCFTIPITYCFVMPFKASCIIKRMSVLDNKPLFQCVKFTLGEIKVLWTSTLYNKRVIRIMIIVLVVLTKQGYITWTLKTSNFFLKIKDQGFAIK